MEDNQIVAEVGTRLRECLGEDRFGLWFGRHTKLSFHQDRLTVFAASTFARDWLRRKFARELLECCSAVTPRDVRLEFDVDPSLATTVAEAQEQANIGNSPCHDGDGGATHRDSATCNAAHRRRPRVGQPPVADPRPEPTLASVVVGKCNEYAFTAAQLVARGLQQASPVLLYGPTGVGKTQLLRAIRAERRRCQPAVRAVYLTAEQFTTSFVEALRGTGLPSFRQKCRGAGLLLVDDLQFFTGKRASLEELLHTIDTLQGEGRQLVLAADRGLGELQSLGRELVSRLAGGLACAIESPEYTTRLGIVRRLAGELNFDLANDLAALVAAEITSTARELRGALHRLQAVSLATGKPMTRELASRILAELAQQCTPVVRLADVEQAVCIVFGVERTDLRSDRKCRAIQEPRMLAMWLARKYTRAAWSEIGQYFGRRSHSTVISAHRRVEQLIRGDGHVGICQQACGVEDAIRRVETALRTA